MIEIDGALPEERQVYVSHVTHNEIKTLVTSGAGTRPFAVVEFRHHDNYHNDIPSSFQYINPVKLEPYEARLLGENLIRAAEEGERVERSARTMKRRKN
jgi:hypothetical protein